MSTESINEPGNSRVVSHTPPSINEPPELPPVPVPTISALSPDNCTVGQPDFTLVVSGENFFAGSVIFFAGHEEPTTFDEEARTLSTGVKPSLWLDPVVVTCQVINGEVMSNAVDFTFAAEGAPLSSHAHTHTVDPDELEEEIDEAIEEGDAFKPTHHSHRGTVSRTLPNKRKR
jgi:hypothetical protein